MSIRCIDLEKRFGSVYRVAYEDGKRHRTRDPWRLILLCRHGHIYPHGGDRLGASTRCRGAIAGRLVALSCVRVAQDGTDGINLVFHVDDFPTVAAILKPRRRRKLTARQVAERTERLRKYRFPAARQSDAASQSDFDGPGRDPTAQPARKPGKSLGTLINPKKSPRP
jgi:hypothetical protein